MKELIGIKYIERKPLKKLDKNPLLLLIHGYGSNEEDLFSFSRDIPEEFHIVSVRGLHTLQWGMYCWYEINIMDAEKFNNIEQGTESREKLVKFIDEITSQENLDKENVRVCGFSQGAILSYSLAFHYPEKVKNIGILSGYPEMKFIAPIDKQKDYSHLDFFISHGTEDPVLPVEWARNAKPLMEEMNLKYRYQEYPGGHGVGPQNYMDFLSWIKGE